MIEFEMDQVINHETGVQPMINGVQSAIWIIPMLDRSTSFSGGAFGGSWGTIDHVGPYAIATMNDVEGLGLAAGDDGDTLTINGTDYTLLAIDPDGQGGAVLKLDEQP
ncbi:hypothetical protein [Desulfobulbus oligotrophicus]|uniref:Uncharacterized protein n=1 Tax=Desulfobulbus oligotrophicus TaxID=1909699 RepID=A0A7T5VED8_9BACT|nr:hypothetical protein [Desulfobulbus oligotrophicus]QQG66357.1 hypothetical protein HP555_11000 [Desulfobulbus oligotrophicus]